MERGTICPMAGRPHYNHQTWQDGRNVVRYVRSEDVASLQEAIDGYTLFRKLAEEYADEIIRCTREQRTAATTRNKLRKKKQKLSSQRKSTLPHYYTRRLNFCRISL